MNSKLKSIYQDYFVILSSRLHAEQKFLHDEKFCNEQLYLNGDMKVQSEAVLKRGTYYDFNGNQKYFIANEIQNLHEEVKQFWQENGEKAIELIKQSQTNKVVVLQERIPNSKRLATYFDSIVVIDPFHNSSIDKIFDGMEDEQDENSNLFKWVGGLVDYLFTFAHIQKILEYDLDEPIYLISPKPELIGVDDKSLVEKQIDESAKLSYEYMKDILGYDVSIETIQDMANFVINLPESQCQTFYSRLKEKGVLSKLLKSTTTVDLKNYRKALLGHHHGVKKELFMSFLLNTTRFTAALRLEHDSQNFNALKGTSKYEWDTTLDYTSIFQYKLKNSTGIDVNHEMINILGSEKIQIFENFQMKDYVRMRELSDMNEMRIFFREHIEKLKKCSIEDFDKFCIEFQAQILEGFKEESKKIESYKLKFRKNLKWKSINFIGFTSLSIATALLPSLAMASLPLGIVTSLVGSKSAYDIFNLHISNKKRQATLANRPVAILMDLL